MDPTEASSPKKNLMDFLDEERGRGEEPVKPESFGDFSLPKEVINEKKDLLDDFNFGLPSELESSLPKEPERIKEMDLPQSKGFLDAEVLDPFEAQKETTAPHSLLKEDSYDEGSMEAFEPSQTPEPEFDLPPPIVPKPLEVTKPKETKIIEEIPKEVPKPAPKEESPKKLSPEFTSDIGAKDLFRCYGLDTWFTPERLHPKVESLVYWRDPKKSGIVFGVILVTLLSLTYFSLISVLAYLCLLTLTVAIAFRIYKNVMQAVQKTSDGHPFKKYLELDVSIPEDKVKELTGVAVAKLNDFIVEMRRLFLVEDLVDSIKLGVILWALTYVGAWFNGLTLVIIGVIAMFSLPKVYENNKSQIDTYLALCTSKISDLTNKVRAAVPMGKKEEKKE